MKRYIKSNEKMQTAYFELDIIAILNPTSVKATEELIEYYPDMDAKYQLTKEQFQAYRDFIKTAVSAIKRRDFEVHDEYQSPISYSYYIEFVPKFFEGLEPDIIFNVKFRLSNHYETLNNSVNDKSSNSDSLNSKIFKSFVVDGVVHQGIVDTLMAITNICNELQLGNYDALQ